MQLTQNFHLPFASATGQSVFGNFLGFEQVQYLGACEIESDLRIAENGSPLDGNTDDWYDDDAMNRDDGLVDE